MKLDKRYEIKEKLGQGGMGMVFRVSDKMMNREVAIKTLRDSPDPKSLEMFYKECDVLANMCHPNIVEIFERGEFEEDGEHKPFFVMPLLRGVTLDQLIRTSSPRLTIERSVEIFTQTCRGLQAAHEKGLVHRDLKPSNIFVLDDDSVKIIDFGVAHIVDSRQSMSQKGTLLYMAPEQIEMKPLSPLTDLFAMGTVCYETLTHRRPFSASTESDVIEAILHLIPPAVSEINPAVSLSISRVIHKAMAKQPYNRFSSAREFSDCLQKAYRNEPIEIFSESRIRPRVERANKAFAENDFQYATEILSELEAEGHIDPAISQLRRQLDQAIRQKTLSQLLESARKRFDEGEFPLALQKVQEILQLDPNNAAALGLKSKVEGRRNDLKIEDWLRLAHQHINNHAYRHAREALQNVLEVRPKETRAMQMLTEVDHKEQEYLKLRESKERSYQAALDAWRNGDVSAALAKLESVMDLDHRAPDSSKADSATSFQSFYNQVRSEHDAINNSYAEAKKHLADRNFSKALAICDNYLIKYPSHALFQALKFDVEEQQRQDMSAYIAEIDQKVEAEPDLDRRVTILEDAVGHYPEEAHFTRALRLTSDKRDLVQSIVSKARHLEEQGHYGDALGQWEILQTIYNRYPGLNLEIERLIKRRDQQVRTEAKDRWIGQIEREMDAANYNRALDLLQSAQAEYQNDAEFLEMERKARQGLERAVEAERLSSQGQELCGQGQFDQGITLLTEARKLDSSSFAIRNVLLDTLVERARAVVDQDWQSAEALCQQALELEPDHALAKSVQKLALDHKRDSYVEQCVSQARQLKSNGDVKGALSLIQEGLALYPREPRLAQLQGSIDKAFTESRRRDVEQMQRLSRDAESAFDAGSTRSIGERTDAIAQHYPDDPELQTLAAGVRQRLAGKNPQAVTGETERPKTAPPAAPPPQDFSESMYDSIGGGRRPARRAEPEPQLEEEEAKAPSSGPGLKLLIVGGALLALLLLAGGIWWFVQHHKAPAAPVAEAVHSLSIQTTPPGATIRVDNEIKGIAPLNLQLKPGTYTVEALAEGYQQFLQDVTISPDVASPPPLSIALTPAIAPVAIQTDMESGKVWLNDQEKGDLQNGLLVLENLSAGAQTVKVRGGASEVAASFELAPANCPVLSGVKAKGIKAVMVARLGGLLRVNATFAPVKISLDGQPSGEVGPQGFELKGLADGNHEIALGEGQEVMKVSVDSRSIPYLWLFLNSARNVGTLLVNIGEDDVRVLLDGKEYNSKTTHGQLIIPNRNVRKYTVQVAKDGYESTPPQQVVEIRKGEVARVEFKLRAVSVPAALVLKGAMPGAQVLLDGNVIGVVLPDGSFSQSIASLGTHSIEIQKENIRFKRLQKEFLPAKTLQIDPNEFGAPTKLAGTVQVIVSPSDSHISYRVGNDGPIVPINGNRIDLSEGAYTFMASAAGHEDAQKRVQVTSGQTQTVTLQLAVAKARASGMERWEDKAAWKTEGQWQVRRGGDFVLYGATPLAGTVEFTATIRKTGILRKNQLQWFVAYKDEKNYVLFEITHADFMRTDVVNGKKTERRFSHQVNQVSDVYTARIIVEPDSISHQFYDGRKWVPVDAYTVPGRNFTDGKFGFLVQGNDEIALSQLVFRPK